MSKLKALELPKKEISAEVLGKTKNLTISAYSDDIALSISDICENYKSDSERRVWCMLLEKYANMTAEDAELYVSMDFAGASGVVNQIHKLTAEFRKSRKEAREAAKKIKSGKLTDREELLFYCVLLGDLTPFNGEFTQQDAIFLNYATQLQLETVKWVGFGMKSGLGGVNFWWRLNVCLMGRMKCAFAMRTVIFSLTALLLFACRSHENSYQC